ncbi:MAG: LytTR family DNA-binding domain-containing protein [Bacteroidota bacterium]
MTKAVIIEDEMHSREFLKNLLQEFHPELTVAGTAEDVQAAVKLIDLEKPRIIFLDIEMQAGTGFDVLQQIESYPCDIIFTTAYDHYAIKAIKFSAIDYLLKPIDIDELNKAIEKVLEKNKSTAAHTNIEMLLNNLKNIKAGNPTITLATSEGLEFVPVKNIIRVEAAGAYTTFHLKVGKKIMVSKNLKEYENLLEGHEFMRVHNSHVINLNEVKKFIKSDGGYIIMNDDSQVVLSPKKRDEFLKGMDS